VLPDDRRILRRWAPIDLRLAFIDGAVPIPRRDSRDRDLQFADRPASIAVSGLNL
jgi:hypothetical protein